MTIIIALLILSLVVLFHELGHFIAARRVGIPVYELSLGFGYKLISIQRKGVQYSIRLIPLGAFVRMAGEEPGDMEKKDGYNNRTPLEKIRVAFAGPFMNFLLAVFIFIFSFAVIGTAVPVKEAIVGKVIPDTPAQKAGIMENDKVLAINGQTVSSWNEFMDDIKNNPTGKPIQITIDRQGQVKNFTLTPVQSEAAGKPVVGVYSQVRYQRQGIVGAVKLGFAQTYQMTAMLVGGMGMLFTGAASFSDLTGPVGITSMASEAAQGGYLIIFTAFLSIALGITNLLPIPALDGSRIIFAIVEAIRRKPLDPEKEGYINWFGFLFLMFLMVFVTYNDIVRLIKG